MLASHDRTRVSHAPELQALSWTAELLHGDHAPVQSLDQLALLAARVGSERWGWLLVQSADESHRFAQLAVAADGNLKVEVGAVIGGAPRHTVWRLEGGHDGRHPGAHFAEIARDWFALGVLPGWTASRVGGHGVDDEPF